ncbi:TPA: hypothetical protein ACGUXQ_002667 [Vibrio vulnificus]
MDLKKLQKAFGSSDIFLGEIDTEIGKLAVFSLRVKGLSILSDLVGSKSIHDIPMDSYIRLLMQVVVYPSELVLEKEEPTSGQITSEQADLLSKDSLDKFATLFLKHHEYLYREHITKRREKEGKVFISFDNGEVIHPKNEDELPHEYLYRLLLIEKKKESERVNKTMARIPQWGKLSKQLMSQYQTTNMIGASLNHSLEQLRASTGAASLVPKIPQPSKTEILKSEDTFRLMDSIAKQNRLKDERERQKENSIQKQEQHLESMIDIMSQSSEYMRNIDNNQRLATEETRKASEEAASIAIASVSIARKGITLAIWGIVLNVFVLTLTAFSVWLTWHQSSSGDQVAQSEMQVMAEGFDKLSTSFSELSEIMRKVSQDKVIAEAALQLSEENSVLKIQVLKQSEQIKQLEKEQENILNQLAQISISNEKNTQKTTPSP